MRRLPPMPTVSDLIRLYGLSAKAQLSQNFLLDLNVSDKLVSVAGPLRESCVCEVGPGPGALTRSILRTGACPVIAVEKDRRFLPSLEMLSDATNGRLEVHHGDVLEFDWEKACASHVTGTVWEEDPPKLHIIGNLPFSVSIPLLLQWLKAIPTRTGPFKFGRCQLTLTFQKEVAERIVAPVGGTQRSRLSIMVQQLCHVQWGFKLPHTVFVPRPKVDAVVVKLTPRVTPAVQVDYLTLEKMVRALFHYRRKMIRNSAKLMFPDHLELVSDLFRISGVSNTLRAQDLSLEQFEALCCAYEHLTKTHCSQDGEAKV